MMYIKLRELKEKDIEGMLEWMHDPSINCFFRFNGEDMNYDKALSFIDLKPENAHHYAVVNEDDEYLGTISLKDIDHINHKAEYAISMRKKYHGTNAARYATDLLINEARKLKLHRIYLNVLSENNRAINFYKKYGFVYEGTSKDDVLIKGKYHDLLWFGLIVEE